MNFSLKQSVKIAFSLLALAITLGGGIYYFSFSFPGVEHQILPLVIFINLIGSGLLLTNTLEINDDHIAIRTVIFKRKVLFKNIVQVDGIGDKSDVLICTKTNQSKEVFFIIMVYENRIQLEKELKRVLTNNNIFFT